MACLACKHAELGEHPNGACKGCGDGHGEDIAVIDVGKLVGDDAAKFFWREDIHDAAGDGHGGVFWVAARGEGVGLVGVDDIECGHGQACVLGEFLGERVDVTAFNACGVVATQDGFVGVPERPEVGGEGDDKGNRHACSAADEAANSHKEGGHEGEEGGGFKDVHGMILTGNIGVARKVDGHRVFGVHIQKSLTHLEYL